MGSSPPDAPLLEDEVDMKRRVTNANNHPPHDASRGTAGGCKHVGMLTPKLLPTHDTTSTVDIDKECADPKHLR